MAEKSIKKNYVFNLAYQLLLVLVPLITAPYLSRVLGPEGIGTYSYTTSVNSFFILFSILGTTTYGQRAVSYVQEDKEMRSRVFWETFIFRVITCAVTFVIYVAIFSLFEQENKIYFIILSANILSNIFDVSWFLQGMEEFGKTVTGNMLCKIICVVLTFLLINDASDLWIYLILNVSTAIVGYFLMWVHIPKLVCKVDGIKPFRGIKDILALFLPTVAIQIYNYLDKAMIGWFTSTNEQNGYYEQAEKIVKVTLYVVTALGPVMVSRISHRFKQGDFQGIKNYLYGSYRFVWMLAIPIMFGILIIADILVPVFFGEGYESSILLLRIFSPMVIFIGLSNVTGLQFMVSTGKNSVYTLTVTVGAIVNILLNLILIPKYFAVGASIATVISEFCVMLCGFIYVLKNKSYKLTPVLTSSWKYWVAGVIMFVALYFIKKTSSVTVVWLLLLVLIGALIYFVSLLLLKDQMLLTAIKNLIKTAKSKFSKDKK